MRQFRDGPRQRRPPLRDFATKGTEPDQNASRPGTQGVRPLNPAPPSRHGATRRPEGNGPDSQQSPGGLSCAFLFFLFLSFLRFAVHLSVANSYSGLSQS